MRIMLDFKLIEIDDIKVIAKFLEKQCYKTCDYTIGGIFMWRKYFSSEYTLYDNLLLFKVYLNGEVAFTMPIGDGNINSAFEQIKYYCNKNSLPIVFCTVPEEAEKIILKSFTNSIISSNRDWFDYLYNAKDILELKGRTYSGQRNHINKFVKNNSGYTFCKIDSSNIIDVKHFFITLMDNTELKSETALAESSSVLEIINNYLHFDLLGGVLYIDKKIVAFSIGEIVKDTLFIHIEKALLEYQGSYQMIVNQFARMYVSKEVLYINREEDVGQEGLRISKSSYHPLRLLKKSTIWCEA